MPLSVSQPILLVEDSPEDFELITRSLKAAGIGNPIHRCTDGDEALDYLEECLASGSKKPPLCPGLILMDLNLPGTDGREVLAGIKEHDSLKFIPVIVLSSSRDSRDIDDCHALGANSYISKPLNTKDFVQAMLKLKYEWFDAEINPKVGELP